MSSQSKKTPYIYQPFGSQNKESWTAKRIYGVSTNSMLTTITSLTKREAEAILKAIESLPEE